MSEQQTASYSRTSTYGEDAIQAQQRQLENYCKDNNLILTKTYIDNGYNGGNFERPGLSELIADAQNGLISKLVMMDMSRIGRNQESAQLLLDLNQNYGLEITFLDGKTMNDILVIDKLNWSMASIIEEREDEFPESDWDEGLEV